MKAYEWYKTHDWRRAHMFFWKTPEGEEMHTSSKRRLGDNKVTGGCVLGALELCYGGNTEPYNKLKDWITKNALGKNIIPPGVMDWNDLQVRDKEHLISVLKELDI